jgi:hypothetical protein
MIEGNDDISLRWGRSGRSLAATTRSKMAEVAAAAVVLAVASDSPDRKLISLCSEYVNLELIIASMAHENESPAVEEIRVAAQHPRQDKQHKIGQKIASITATTAEGHAAKARALLAYGDPSAGWNPMVRSLLDGLAVHMAEV